MKNNRQNLYSFDDRVPLSGFYPVPDSLIGNEGIYKLLLCNDNNNP